MCRPRRRTVALSAAGLLVLGACTTPDGAAVATGDLPEGWSSEPVDDDREGTFTIARPDDAVLWQMGDDVDEIDAEAGDTTWGGFWIPQLDRATSDRDNVRALAVLRDEEGVVSWQVNVATTTEELPTDPDELAAAWADRFRSQELDVEVETTTEWADRTIAHVEFRVPESVFDGEVRYVRQSFVTDDEHDRLWSFVCDAPADETTSAATCDAALDGFRPSDAPTGVEL